MSPTSVSLSGTGGQTVPVTSSGSPTQEITYTIGAPNYSGDSTNNNGINWLTVSGGTTTPSNLNFNLFQTAGLSQGTHTATVTLTPSAPAGVTAVVITVTYTSGSSGGGGSGTLTGLRTRSI